MNPMLNGILRWSLSQTPADIESPLQPLSEEDKRFLTEAMDSLVVDETLRLKILYLALQRVALALHQHQSSKDDNDQLHSSQQCQRAEEIVKAVFNKKAKLPSTSSSSTSTEDEEWSEEKREKVLQHVREAEIEALDELDERLLTIDNALDAIKLGFLPVLGRIVRGTGTATEECQRNQYQMHHIALKWRAAQCLATMMQNNPKGKEAVLENRLMDDLLEALQSDLPMRNNQQDATTVTSTANHEAIEYAEEKAKVRVKSLYALSAIIRDSQALTDAFVLKAGVELLVELISSLARYQQDLSDQNVRLVTKAIGLLRTVLPLSNSSFEIAQKCDVVHIAATFIGHEDINLREEAVRILAALVQLSLVLPVDVKNKVQQRIKEMESLTGEEAEMCQSELDTARLAMSEPGTHNEDTALSQSSSAPIMSTQPDSPAILPLL